MAAADASWWKEVTGFDGTFEEAIEEGIVTMPPPMMWNRWQPYRTATETRPDVRADGPEYQIDNRHEVKIYLRVMKHYDGEDPIYKQKSESL